MRKLVSALALISLLGFSGAAFAETPVVSEEDGTTFTGHDAFGFPSGRSTDNSVEPGQNAGTQSNSMFFDGDTVHLETNGGEQTLPGDAGAATDGNAEDGPGVDNHF